MAEHFYSIQGEGPSQGKRSVFLRLKACNLMCGGQGTEFDKGLHNGATWRCDTIETWRKGQTYGLDDLLNLFIAEGYIERLSEGAHLIVTGGEPFLQIEAINKFIENLCGAIPADFHTEIETNGTIYDDKVGIITQINCSPKLSNSGMPLEKRYQLESLEGFAQDPRTIWKFVVSRLEDVCEIEFDFVQKLKLEREKIWIMPAASNQLELRANLPFCAQIVKDHGWNLTNRLQISIWDKVVGV